MTFGIGISTSALVGNLIGECDIKHSKKYLKIGTMLLVA